MSKAHLTAIKRKTLSLPMAYLHQHQHIYPTCLSLLRSLDFGCGRGDDAEILGFAKYDPHYFPNSGWRCLEWDVITCNYVLNVIEDESERNDVLFAIQTMLAPDGVAFISVRRDVKVTGRTKKGTYQCDVFLELPVLHEAKGKYCIYTLNKLSKISLD
jgi:hypothetical protein